MRPSDCLVLDEWIKWWSKIQLANISGYDTDVCFQDDNCQDNLPYSFSSALLKPLHSSALLTWKPAWFAMFANGPPIFFSSHVIEQQELHLCIKRHDAITVSVMNMHRTSPFQRVKEIIPPLSIRTKFSFCSFLDWVNIPNY